MEMTRNYEGWEFEHSTVLTRQVVASKVRTVRLLSKYCTGSLRCA